MSGLTADARTLIDHARVEAQVLHSLVAVRCKNSVCVPLRVVRHGGTDIDDAVEPSLPIRRADVG